MPNRLATETSPYLLQHASNPVDWQPWGEEAFAEAHERDVPVVVSIGYAACHWCHVMERESFEDPAVAAVMNERFVCVKVDREERPDVDAIYMDAVQAMTGQGGWPLHAFLTPDGVPFHTGTYFPPQPRQGMPSWPQVLEALADAWRDRREEVEQVTAKILPRLAGAATLEAPAAEFDPAALDAAVVALRSAYDAEHGGWGGAPKFPSASVIEFLLARAALAGPDGGAEERRMALHALRRMAAGGIYDQLGGGFARYAVDARWIVPHFEKMLYDNALLARAYLHAFQLTGEARFREVAVETLDWAVRDLRREEGGFASSLDADSEGEEGRFYVWTRPELEAVLGADRAALAATRYGVIEPGTFEGRASVLVRAAPDPPGLAEIRAELLAARERRVPPALDDKRLTSWNALMITALADAGAVLGRADYLEAARACADFVLGALVDGDGRLLRSYNRGVAKTPAFLEDHAFLLEALLALYEATFEPRWFTAARALADTLLARFADPERGGFFSVADDHAGLVARRKDLEDSPIPAGASSAALGLLRLSRLTGEAAYEDAALGQLRLLHTLAPQHPVAFGHLLQALQFAQAPVREVALAGPADGVRALAGVVRETLRPFTVLAGGEAEDGPELLEGRTAVDGAAAAYVCERFTCRLPVTSADALRAGLELPPRGSDRARA